MDGLKRLLLSIVKEHKDAPPICYHCGKAYKKDLHKCSNYHSTWMPNCMCINKIGIRIVTGAPSLERKNE